jgi:N-acetylmuramoyl-L-alanine amidase
MGLVGWAALARRAAVAVVGCLWASGARECTVAVRQLVRWGRSGLVLSAVIGVTVLGATGCSRLLGLSSGSASPAMTSDSTPTASPPAGTITTSSSPAASENNASKAAPGRGSGAGGLLLAGKVVGLDPGHNGGNFTDAAYIDRQIWNGRDWEDCNTTGTATDGGYTEALFNFQVASYLRADLVVDGARVVMTRTSNSGVGPCVNQRAAIINAAHANVGIAIHADGATPAGRGFAILVPVADGPNDKVISSSLAFADDVRVAMLAGTPMPVSNYDGVDAIQSRDNLAGLNLAQVPMVLIEVGNMRNATDAALETSPAFQREVAQALCAAIVRFLT